ETPCAFGQKLWSDHRRNRELRLVLKGVCMALSEKQKMLSGQLYHASCPELQAEQIANKHWMHRYNASVELLNDARHGLLVEHFAQVGEGAVIRPPFYCDYGY